MNATDNQTLIAVAGPTVGRQIDVEATTGCAVVWRAAGGRRLRAPS